MKRIIVWEKTKGMKSVRDNTYIDAHTSPMLSGLYKVVKLRSCENKPGLALEYNKSLRDLFL